MSLPTFALHILLPSADIAVALIARDSLETPATGEVILGSGAFGTVRLMLLRGQNIPVAVKQVRPEDRELMIREARAMTLLSSHPSFPTFHGLLADGQERALVIEFVGDQSTGESLTLHDSLSGPRRLTLAPSTWSSIALDMVDGMKYMHDQGLLHNDFKDDNVLVRYAGGTWHACIIDVGLCTLEAYPRVRNLTEEQKERFRRFHAHIAPELVEDGAPETQLSDVFQLGLVLQFVGQNGGVPELVRLGDWCGRRDPQRRPSAAVLRLIITGLTH